MSTGSQPGTQERELLRESVRGYLAQHWPPAQAVALQADAAALAAIWRGLAQQGLTTLGSNPEAGGLAETLVAIEELGRAACPNPLVDAVLLNIALCITEAPHAAAPALRELQQGLHDGSAQLAISFAGNDEGRNTGSASAVTLRGGRLFGVLRFVDGAQVATRVLAVLGQGERVALVDWAAPGCTVTVTRAMGMDGLSDVTLSGCPAQLFEWPAGLGADLHLIRRLCLLARAHGAARRAFEMAVDYAKERQQFGKPIGSFQAVQHKLANGLISLEGVRLTLANAAVQYDAGAHNWRYFVSAACAFGGPVLRQVSLETHHAFGAIGYAEEHEAPRHFRRVHLDTLAMGGVRRARGELAAHFFDGDEHSDAAGSTASAGGAVGAADAAGAAGAAGAGSAAVTPDPGALPRHDLGEAGNALRTQVGEWLAAHWSGERKAAFDAQAFHHREFDAGFAKDIGTTGWIGLTWPREHGGQARSPVEQVAFMEEMERAEAPRIGAAIQSTGLMLFGTPAQQQQYLPEILRGEAMHGMGYSEPNAGSDLASLKTSAVREGDEWVINGQKIWTTTWWGKYMFLAARTNREAKPAHAGISMFIVPMNAPGIDIKPAATMYDGTFANIFYDNVRLPADALLGEENGGWKVLTSALATERGLVGGGIVLKVAHAFELLCGLIRESEIDGKPMRADALVRDRVAQFAAEIEVGRQLMMHCAELAGSGPTPPEVGAISKVFSGELMERFHEAALEILGMRATLSQGAPGNLLNGRVEQGLRHSLMWVISIGTNEIQRSLIAQRGLGLPR